ncbi:MAG: prepilin-type N-terminal cleavage/methylation domain-containing protein [Acidobacteria bacterium]|nr:prepilin-type N-terminal cleavage/methylation domain-containing protein [Acidobacteriota bacterium]
MSNRTKGYSLVELLASTAVVMVLSAMSFPMANSGVGRYRLYSDADRLAAQFQNARFRAISTNFSHRVHINGNSIELQRLEGGVATVVESFPLRPGIQIADAWASDPVFSPRGTVSPSVGIVLEDQTGTRRTLSISVLGRVSGH